MSYVNLRCMTYDIVGRTYDVVTYDIQEYRRYDVTYNIVTVGVTYDVVVTDLRYRMWQESRHREPVEMELTRYIPGIYRV